MAGDWVGVNLTTTVKGNMGITDGLGADEGVFDEGGDNIKETAVVVFEELVSEEGGVIAGCDLSSRATEDANFGCDAAIGVDGSQELVRVAKGVTGDEGVDKVADDREAEGDLELHAGRCA